MSEAFAWALKIWSLLFRRGSIEYNYPLSTCKIFPRVMPLFVDLQDFSAIFAPNVLKFDLWVWHKKRGGVFSSFPWKGFRA